MDILLINPYSEESTGINETTVEVPVGLLSLASFLEDKGVKVGLLDAYALLMKQSDVIEEVKRHRPRAVGISVNIFSFLQAIRYTQEIKKISQEIIVIWGGPHPTIAWDICLNKSKADIMVVGEGELTLHESLKKLLVGEPIDNVSGIAYRDNGDAKINPSRERILDLNSLPLPAYHLLPELNNYKTRARRLPFMGIVTSRGCPFSCIYCSKDVFKNRITMRSPENIIEEIDRLVKDYQIRQIDILDDNFTADLGRIDKLCELIIKRDYKLYINLQSGIRADKVNQAIIKKLKRAGVFKLAVGVESGNQTILHNIKKELNLDQIIEASRISRGLGIIVIGFFIIGLPGDNERTLQETIDFAVRMNPHIANFMMAIPFYGTEFYNKVEREGKLLVDTKEGISAGFYAAKAYYELGELKPDIMVRYYKKAYKDFYFRPSKMIDLFRTVKSFEELKWLYNTGSNTLFVRN